MLRKIIPTIVISFAIFIASTKSAYAYIDPGTASLILQIVIGTVISAFATVGIYWQRVKSFLRKFFFKKNG